MSSDIWPAFVLSLAAFIGAVATWIKAHTNANSKADQSYVDTELKKVSDRLTLCETERSQLLNIIIAKLEMPSSPTPRPVPPTQEATQ